MKLREKFSKWLFRLFGRVPRGYITNVRDATILRAFGEFGAPPTEAHVGNSICTTCGKLMPTCWDTVCAVCGDTSCYDHSGLVEGRWRCRRHTKIS